VLHFIRRSLLVQLLSVYLIFVLLVLGGGVAVDGVIEQRLTEDVQASNQALAQEIALRTNLQLVGAQKELVEISKLVLQSQTPEELQEIFQVFKSTHSDVDQVYWLDAVGILRLSWPEGNVGLGSEFSPPGVVQQALRSNGPVFEVGIATATATRNAGVIVASPVRNAAGTLTGIVAASFSLVELSLPLQTVVQAQEQLHRNLIISVVDESGKLIATSQPQRILQTVLDELPGAEEALKNNTTSRLGTGPDGKSWLFSAVTVPDVSWAVVVQRPVGEALSVVSEFRLWLLAAALIFALGGLLFWFLLLGRVIQPLHNLAAHHQALPTSKRAAPQEVSVLPGRADEVGALARSLTSLEQDGLKKLGELQTLLETSNAVVGSFEPRAVVRKIIREVRRLVDVQAATVLLPDEAGVLHVMVSDGHSEHYEANLALAPDNSESAPVQALREGQPVQKLLAPGVALSYDEGFRSVLAIPIIGRHSGAVVLLVHRSEPHPFDQNEINLLLTFANYATLAWEHAVLYERSDERLRIVAKENERLYRQASQEKQKLEAIMGSMNDGLILTSLTGTVLYANQGVAAIAGIACPELENHPIDLLYAALWAAAENPRDCESSLAQAEAKQAAEFIVDIKRQQGHQAIHFRRFDVDDGDGRALGKGLLLRDITREHDLDAFKTTLLAAVGHELRTPLAVIKGHASTLLQEDVTWSIADQRYSLQKISGEADRLARLVSNLLDLSRQEAGLLLLNCESVQLQAVVAATLDGFNSNTTRITLDIPEDLPEVNIDRARIEVVLHNLIANATVYGEGEVRVRATQRENKVIVAVWDNGPGIAPEELPHIFERFYRARQGYHKYAGGSGLGLAICKAFIEAHQSNIWVESESGQGTTISFSLPISARVETGGEPSPVGIFR
jgi:signal transduction histidine kinase/HAMP domain-containing protein